MSTLPTTWNGLQEAANAHPVLGYTVCWNLTDMAVPHDQVVATLGRHNLEEFAPAPPSPKVALRRALAAMLRDKVPGLVPDPAVAGIDDDTRIMIRERPARESEWFLFAVVAETADLAEMGFTYQTEVRIKVHKKSGAMYVSDQESGAIDEFTNSPRLTAALAPYWEHYRALHTARDLSVVTRQIIGWLAALALRREGGVYFVPATREADLHAVNAWLDELAQTHGGDDTFLMIGVPDSDALKAKLAHAAHRDLKNQLVTLEKEVDEVLADPKTQAKTLVRRLGDVGTLVGVIHEYTDLLQMKQDDMLDRLARLQRKAGDAIRAHGA